LATKARKSLPADPAVAQLLGQLSYEKKEYSRALQLLQESARKKPLDAEGLYYLGVSYKEAKQPAEARKALTAALAAGLSSPSADVAQRILAELNKR
jgi:Flp pilus assembly protein TadD